MSTLIDQLRAGLAGRYDIERPLGEGGMAVVFQATDLRHERQVALKVLRPELSAVVGADRFLREIRVTANLQHPHILPLYDSGTAGELLFYVMPMVQGESLRDRLTRERQLPVDEAVALTRAVAGGLGYAHRQGVLHRDIKPENILLQDGQPLLADFGIALAVSAAGGERLTRTGFSIGTPSYMSPEQASGEHQLDARSDLYALACVAYEMLAGEPPFSGPTLQAVLAAAVTGQTRPLLERRPTTPVPVAAAIHRALLPVPADRFATAADFAAALAGPVALTLPPAGGRRRPWRVAGLVAAGAAAGLAAGLLAHRAIAHPRPPEVRRWNVVLPADEPVALTGPGRASAWQTAIALSPDGSRLAYISPQGNTTALSLRSLDSDSVLTLPGTEGAYAPFYSPDGAWIGFFAGNLLRKIPATGGNPVTLGQVDRVTGAVWAPGDRILVLENEGFDLHMVSASGTAADSTIHLTTQFGTPDLLPGGQWLVGQLSSGQLALLSVRNGTELAITRRGVLPLDSVRQSDLLFGESPRWIPSGQLVYAAGDGVLSSMPFDGARRRVLGEPAPILTGVRMEAGFGYGEFAVADEGTLVYVPGRNQLWVNIAFVAPDGRIDTLPFPRAQYTQPRISPDGRSLALQLRKPLGGWEVVVFNLATGVQQQVPVEGNYRAFPASWLPSGRDLMIGLFDPVQFLNYGARIQSLETGKWHDLHMRGMSYMTVAPDGKQFVFSDWRSGDLYLRSLDGDTTRTHIPARGFAASFSPDGKWVAWGDVNGGIAVSPVPPTGAIYPVADQGQMPLWTPRGDGIVFRSGSAYYRAPVSTTGGFRAGRPTLLAEGPFLSTFAWNHSMSPDGRLLVLLGSPKEREATLGVMTGFPEFLRRATATSRPTR